MVGARFRRNEEKPHRRLLLIRAWGGERLRRGQPPGLRALGRFGAVPGGMFRGLPRHEGGAVIAGGSHCSAAQRLRALGWFADAGWQDLRAVHDSRGPCSEKGPFLARSSRGVSSDGDLRGFSDTWRAHLAKASSFWMHGARILPRIGDSPVRGHFRDAWSAKLAMG